MGFSAFLIRTFTASIESNQTAAHTRNDAFQKPSCLNSVNHLDQSSKFPEPLVVVGNGSMQTIYRKKERRKDSKIVEQIVPVCQLDGRYLLSSTRRSHYVGKKKASNFLQRMNYLFCHQGMVSITLKSA